MHQREILDPGDDPLFNQLFNHVEQQSWIWRVLLTFFLGAAGQVKRTLTALVMCSLWPKAIKESGFVPAVAVVVLLLLSFIVVLVAIRGSKAKN